MGLGDLKSGRLLGGQGVGGLKLVWTPHSGRHRHGLPLGSQTVDPSQGFLKAENQQKAKNQRNGQRRYSRCAKRDCKKRECSITHPRRPTTKRRPPLLPAQPQVMQSEEDYLNAEAHINSPPSGEIVEAARDGQKKRPSVHGGGLKSSSTRRPGGHRTGTVCFSGS